MNLALTKVENAFGVKCHQKNIKMRCISWACMSTRGLLYSTAIQTHGTDKFMLGRSRNSRTSTNKEIDAGGWEKYRKRERSSTWSMKTLYGNNIRTLEPQCLLETYELWILPSFPGLPFPVFAPLHSSWGRTSCFGDLNDMGDMPWVTNAVDDVYKDEGGWIS